MRGRVRNCQSDYQLNLTEMEEREERGEREGRGMICVLDKMTTRSHFCPEFNVHNRPYSSYCVTRLRSRVSQNAAKDLNIQLGSSSSAPSVEWTCTI